MTGRDARIMREQLAAAGIVIEPRPAPRPAPAHPEARAVDRDAIRAVLVTAGAPARDIDWLTASCPSMAEALAYRPTIHAAWCGDCGDVVASNADGCIACKAAS